MKPTASTFSAKRHLLLAGIGAGGAFLGWNLWFAAGGWQRHQHFGEAALWGISSAAGLWETVRAMRSVSDVGWVTMLGLMLGLFHALSLVLLLLFLQWLASGGPRP